MKEETLIAQATVKKLQAELVRLHVPVILVES